MSKRTLLFIGLGLLLVAAIYGWREYDRAPERAADKTAEETLAASELLKAFTTDEPAANKRFNDKVVQVTGTVASISAPENGKVTVLLDTGDALSGIACEFDAADAPKASPGERITIKGICAGFNLDVLLQRCAVE